MQFKRVDNKQRQGSVKQCRWSVVCRDGSSQYRSCGVCLVQRGDSWQALFAESFRLHVCLYSYEAIVDSTGRKNMCVRVQNRLLAPPEHARFFVEREGGKENKFH